MVVVVVLVVVVAALERVDLGESGIVESSCLQGERRAAVVVDEEGEGEGDDANVEAVLDDRMGVEVFNILY